MSFNSKSFKKFDINKNDSFQFNFPIHQKLAGKYIINRFVLNDFNFLILFFAIVNLFILYIVNLLS